MSSIEGEEGLGTRLSLDCMAVYTAAQELVVTSSFRVEAVSRL